MKAIILAAGRGTRLRPLTLTILKPAVPVANKPLVQYPIDMCKAAGIDEIGIVVDSLESSIPNIFGDGSALDVNIEYIVQEEQLGLAHAVDQCKAFVGDEPFVVFLGDNIFQDKMTDLLRDFPESDANAALVLTRVPDPSRFGIAVVDDNDEIVRVVEKPKDPPSDLAIVGVYLFRPNVFDIIAELEPSARGEYEITDAIQGLIDEEQTIKPYTVQGWYVDAGKPAPLILANQLVLEEMPYSPPPAPDDEHVDAYSEVTHRVVLGEGVRIINSTIRGPVIIGDNTIIEDSYVGPFTSIGNDCEIGGSDIECSIIMDDCIIDEVPGRLDRCLISAHSEVTGAEKAPSATRLVLGEYSVVEL